MGTQYLGALLFRMIHHLPNTGNGMPCILHRSAHGGRQECRHAEGMQITAHGTNISFATHGIMTFAGMDMHIHKTGQQVFAFCLHHFFPNLRGQVAANFRHNALFQPDIHMGMKTCIYISCRITNQHGTTLLLCSYRNNSPPFMCFPAVCLFFYGKGLCFFFCLFSLVVLLPPEHETKQLSGNRSGNEQLYRQCHDEIAAIRH